MVSTAAPAEPVLLSGAPFLDTSPDDLVFGTDAPRLPALAVHRARPAGHPGTALELRVLGASHQLVLERAGTPWIETLACRPGRRPHLPGRHRAPAPAPFARDYEAACTVTAHDRGGLAAAVEDLLADCAAAPHGLVVRFAGDPLALTGVCADDDGGTLRWRTWHVYPQCGRVVRTRSALRLLPEDPA